MVNSRKRHARHTTALLVAALAVALLAGCAGSAPANAPTTPPAVASATRPMPTPSFGLTLPFAKEGDTGQKPAFVTVEDIPIMGFYVKPGALVLAPHEATQVEVMLVTESTALLSKGGLVLNFIHPAGFATQVYLWQGEAVQEDKSGAYRTVPLTEDQPTLAYGPVQRGQVVAIVGDAFPQPEFSGASLLLTLARSDGSYVPPDTLWLNGKPQYLATPTPEK